MERFVGLGEKNSHVVPCLLPSVDITSRGVCHGVGRLEVFPVPVSSWISLIE